MVLYQYPPQSIQVSSGPVAIEVDGVPTNVSIDTVTPANTVALPVSIYSSSGPINITAGDINVQLTDLGVNFDRTRIGDGTNQWNMNASNEGLIHDASANAELDSQTALLTTIDADTGSIDAKLPALVGGRIPVDGSGVTQPVSGPLTDAQLRASAVPVSMASAPIPTGAATEAKQDTQITSLSSIDTKLSSQATAANQVIEQGLVGALTETAPGTDTASSGLNGRLQRIAQRITTSISSLTDILNRLTDIFNGTGSQSDATVTNPATNATILSYTRGVLSRLSTQLPAALGQTTMSASLPVTISSDQTTLPVSLGSPSAVTVKQAQVTVGTSAIRLTTDGSAPSTTRIRLDFRPSAASTARFFYGSSGVTTSNGLEIFPGESVQLLNDVNDYYIISNTAAQTVAVVEAE